MNGRGEFQRRIIRVGNFAVRGDFHGRIGVEPDEGGHFVQGRLGALAFHRGGNRIRDGEQELDVVAVECARTAGPYAEHAEGSFRRCDGDTHAADNPVLKKIGGAGEPFFGAQIGDRDWFAGGQGVTREGIAVGLDLDGALGIFLPAGASAEGHQAPFGLQFEHLAKLDFQRLANEGDRLIQERGKVVAHQGELAKRGDDRLLQGAIEQALLVVLVFFRPLLDGCRHRIEGLGELSHFAGFAGELRAGGKVSAAEPARRREQGPDLSYDEAFASEPGGAERQNADEKAGPGNVGKVEKNQARGNGHENRSHQSGTQARKNRHRCVGISNEREHTPRRRRIKAFPASRTCAMRGRSGWERFEAAGEGAGRIFEIAMREMRELR